MSRTANSAQRWIGLILTLGIAVGLGCASDEESLSEHLANAEALFAVGELKEASIELRNALKLDPQNPETNFRIAELMERQGQLEDAIFFFGETQRLDPTRMDAAVREAALLIFDDPVRVEELLAEVLESDPGNVDAYVVRSRRAVIEANLEEALADVATALELDPDHEPAHMQLGKIHQARLRMAQLKGEKPDDSIYEEGLAAFQRVIELGGQEYLTFGAHFETAKIYGNWEGHVEKAADSHRAAIETALSLNDRQLIRDALRTAQNFGLRVGDNTFTKWVLDKRIEFNPADISAWKNLTTLREKAGEDGRATMDRLLELQPDSQRAQTLYAEFLASHGELDEALAHLESKIAEGVDPPALMSSRATLLTQAGRDGEAKAASERMQREYPTDPRSIIVRARQALEDDRNEEAAVDLRKVVESYDRPEAYNLLAAAERRLGNTQAALDAVVRLLESSAGGRPNFESLRLRAQLEAELGRCDSALHSYTVLTKAGSGELPDIDRFLQSRCLYDQGFDRLARSAMKRLFQDGRRPPYAVVEWADHEKERDPEATRVLLEEALLRAPNHPGLLSRMAAFDLKDGNKQQALDRFNKAIESGQASPGVVLDRAAILLSIGDIEAAERDALRAFEADPSLEDASALLLTIYAMQGKTDEAIRSFEEAHAAGALQPPAIGLLSKLHIRANNEKRALELLEELLSKQESSLPGVKNDMAYLLAKESRDLDRALALAQDAQRSLSKAPMVADTLGFVYLQRGLYDPALQQFRYAMGLVKTDEKPPVLHYHEGLALQALGRHDEAIASFEKALKSDADFEDAAAALRAAKATDATSSS